MSDRLYRELFCRQYGFAGPPVVPLATIAHWQLVARALGLGDLSLNRAPAYVTAGYFYAVHTPAPTHDEALAAIELARERSAAALVPSVRRDASTAALQSAGFRPLPWFFQAEYHVTTGVDDDLRAQLGGKRHRELRRIERRCEVAYRTKILVGDELDAGTFAEFERLHELNLSKYGHARNQYPRAALSRMAASALGPRMVMLLMTPRWNPVPVQALFGLLDADGKRIVVPVQGIDHIRVPRGHNLYVAGFMKLFRWGVERGVAVFDLGRGAERTKLDLGANTFHILDNYVHPAGLARLDGAERLSAACDARIAAGLRGLAEAVERRAAVASIRLPAEAV
jgi:hypothetical protein